MKHIITFIILITTITATAKETSVVAKELKTESAPKLYKKVIGESYSMRFILSVADFDQFVELSESTKNGIYQYSISAKPLKESHKPEALRKVVAYQPFLKDFGFPLFQNSLDLVDKVYEVQYKKVDYLVFIHKIESSMCISIWTLTDYSYIGSYSGGMGMVISATGKVKKNDPIIQRRAQLISHIFNIIFKQPQK